MSKYIAYQSKIISNDTTTNNTNTSNVTTLANSRDIMGSLNSAAVSPQSSPDPSQYKYGYYYTARDLLKDDRFLCSMVNIGAKIICGRNICPEGKDIILKDYGKDSDQGARFEVICGCAKEEDSSWYDWFSIGPEVGLDDPNKFISQISDLVKAIINDCVGQVESESFEKCIEEKGVYVDLEYLQTLAQDYMVEITEKSIDEVKDILGSDIQDAARKAEAAADQLNRLKEAVELAEAQDKIGGQAGIDKITEIANKILACAKEDLPCEAKVVFSSDVIKAILQAIKREKQCYIYPPGFDPHPPEAPYEAVTGLILNQETCECECDKPGFTRCDEREFCIKCGENARVEKRLAIPTLSTWTCGCACEHGYTNHRLPGTFGLTINPNDPNFWENPYSLDLHTKCLPECNRTGYQFVEIDCNKANKTPSFFQLNTPLPDGSTKARCFDCACVKKIESSNPRDWGSKTEIVDETCEVPDSQIDARLNCECNCLPPLQRVDNPNPISVQMGEDPFICIEPCGLSETPVFSMGMCISDDCIAKFNDPDPKKHPPSICPGLQHLDSLLCRCVCNEVVRVGKPLKEKILPDGTKTCECDFGYKMYFHPKYPPNLPGQKPRRPPVYDKNFRCRNCKPNETYNWDLDRCIPKSSGPSNVPLQNIQSLGYIVENNIEVY